MFMKIHISDTNCLKSGKMVIVLVLLSKWALVKVNKSRGHVKNNLDMICSSVL